MRVHRRHVHVRPGGHAEVGALDAIAPVTHAHVGSELLHGEERRNGRGGITEKEREEYDEEREKRKRGRIRKEEKKRGNTV